MLQRETSEGLVWANGSQPSLHRGINWRIFEDIDAWVPQSDSDLIALGYAWAQTFFKAFQVILMCSQN